jgi:hypothetical protein
MNNFIAIIGLYDENTTEQIALKEISIQARDEYEAHKKAIFKCNERENQLVLKVLEANGRKLKFDFQKGFNP